MLGQRGSRKEVCRAVETWKNEESQPPPETDLKVHGWSDECTLICGIEAEDRSLVCWGG